MSCLVKVIVHNLAQVNQSSLLQLHLYSQVNLDTGCVDYPQVSDIVLVILLDNHELAFPELLVIGDLIVVVVTLTHLELRGVAIKSDHGVLQFFSVHIDKLQLEVLGGAIHRCNLEGLLAQVHALLQIIHLQLVKLNSMQLWISSEELEVWSILKQVVNANVLLTDQLERFSFTLSDPHLVLNHIDLAFHAYLAHQLINLRTLVFEGDREVSLDHEVLILVVVGLEVLMGKTHLTDFSEGIDELI